MKDYYILIFKESGERRGYTSRAAIFEENKREDIGVSLSTLARFDFYDRDYENSLCKIERIKFKTRGDIIREREQFL